MTPQALTPVPPIAAYPPSGETLYLRVNGVAMFMKGANLIPFHTIRTMVTPERMNATLQGALDGEGGPGANSAAAGRV
jgi:hypothetical protein